MQIQLEILVEIKDKLKMLIRFSIKKFPYLHFMLKKFINEIIETKF